MTVIAVCSDCGDEHPLGDRLADWTTTRCPVCASTSYMSKSTSEDIVKSEAERIADAVRPVEGVGEATVVNIVNTFSTYIGLESADTDQLTAIENVGQQTAENIQERIQS